MYYQKIKLPSNRSFGLLFFLVFLIISLWPLSYEGEIRIVTLIISIIFLIYFGSDFIFFIASFQPVFQLRFNDKNIRNRNRKGTS